MEASERDKIMKPRRTTILMLLLLIAGIAIGIQSERTRLNKARYSKTRAHIAELQVALERYRVDNGYYPTTDQGLSALGEYYSDGPWKFEPPEIDPGMVYPRRPVSGPHPTDAWGNLYFYESDGNAYELRSFGPNGSEDRTLVARSPD
jgi:general secretion pathway protein G